MAEDITVILRQENTGLATFLNFRNFVVENVHSVKSVRIRSFSGLYFPAFGMNTERYGVYLRIQSECGKIRTRKAPNTDSFHAVFS